MSTTDTAPADRLHNYLAWRAARLRVNFLLALVVLVWGTPAALFPGRAASWLASIGCAFALGVLWRAGELLKPERVTWYIALFNYLLHFGLLVLVYV